MMNAALILGLSVLLIPGGHCRPQVTFSALQGALEAVQFLTTSSISKRQTGTLGTCTFNDYGEFLANYPRDCAAEINVLLANLQSQNAVSTALNAAFRLLCEPRCGNPFIAFYRRCGVSQYINFARALCARNDANRLCYEQFSSITSDQTQVTLSCTDFQLSTACSSECQIALRTYRSNSGCCINIFNATIFGTNRALENNLWSGCSVDTPGFCNLETSTLSSAEALRSVKAIFLLTSAVMAMLLL